MGGRVRGRGRRERVPPAAPLPLPPPPTPGEPVDIGVSSPTTPSIRWAFPGAANHSADVGSSIAVPPGLRGVGKAGLSGDAEVCGREELEEEKGVRGCRGGGGYTHSPTGRHVPNTGMPLHAWSSPAPRRVGDGGWGPPGGWAGRRGPASGWGGRGAAPHLPGIPGHMGTASATMPGGRRAGGPCTGGHPPPPPPPGKEGSVPAPQRGERTGYPSSRRPAGPPQPRPGFIKMQSRKFFGNSGGGLKSGSAAWRVPRSSGLSPNRGTETQLYSTISHYH